MKRFLGCAALAALVAGAGSTAMAGGFGLKEGSASALGAAFSGATAGANDVTYTYWNPAALTNVEGFEIGAAASGIFPTAEGVTNSTGDRVDGSEMGFVPAAYFGARVNDKLVLGLSTSSPFGLATEYEKNAFGPGGAARSALTLVQIAPMVSYDVTPTLAIAGGPTIVVGNLIFERANTGVGNLELDVDDVAFGFQLGALWKAAPGTTIGLSYHSGYNLSAEGDANTGIGTLPATFSADLPALATFGVRQQISDRFALQGEVQWQQWSSLDAAQIDVGAPVGTSQNRFDYEDAWLFAVGGEFAATEALTLRTGIAYDQTPTSDATRSVRIPDQDRLWFAVGASYALTENTTVDFGYTYLTAMEDAVADTSAVAGNTSVNFDELNAHIISLGGSFKF